MKYLSIQTFQCGISVSGAATFTGGATINLLALNGATTSSEASLFLGAHGTTEGGQLVLQKGTSQTYAAHLDNYSDQFRILYGTNTGSTGVALAVSLSTRQLILPAYTTSTSFSGTAAGYLAFDSSGNIITTSVPVSGVSSIIAGTGVTVSSGTGNVTVSIGQSVATSATPSFDQIFLTNNGNGTNVKIGDDAWIGDVNAANSLRIMGQQNNANGYIIFGNSDFTALGRSGTGNLTYGGSTVWTAATLTNLNQLTNGPGYITSAALSGYVPTSRTLTINGTSYDLSADRTWTINTVAYTSRIQHQVKAGVAINKGQAVYVTSADGTNMIVGLASNTAEATSSKTMGLLDATVAINGFANVVTEGLLAGLDTSSAGTEGDPVWLGTGGNLIYGLTNKPYAPNHLVFIGIVTRKNINNGEIFVKVQNGFELEELHNVDLKTTVPVNGNILGFDGTLWVNKTIAGWLGYTPANASGTTNYLSKFTGSTTLGDSKIVDNGSTIQFLVNSQNANSKFYMSPVHADGRINFNAVAGTNDYTLLRTWHSADQIGIGSGSSAGGGALTTRGDSVLIGGSGALYFMNGTFGPLNVPYRLGISASATTTYFGTGVSNNLTNIESNAFQYTAKSHTFYTGTTAGNQSEPNQYTPLFLSTGGNVVVGSTTDSGYKLEVKNTSGSSALRISNNNDGSGMRFGISNGANSQYLDLNYWVTLQAFAGYSMNLSVGSAYGVYLDSSNNVGIGTNAPAYKMHVAGSLGVVTPGNASAITLVGDNNHSSIFKIQNTDSTNTTFGFNFATYSDGGSNRYLELGGFNTTANNFNGNWNFNSTAIFSAGLQSNYWQDFNIYHVNSNAGQAIKFWSLGPTGSGGVIVSFVNTGNVLIGTTTDSGYRLDVNGTARINSSLYITDSAYTGAGRLFQSANNTFVVTGGPGGGSENITFGPSNRIFINASQTRVSSLFQIAGGLSVGTWTYPGTYGAQAYIGGSTTANGGGGRGLYIDSTVVAAADNDVLVGLDVNPTFTNGAFTGVSNLALRVAYVAGRYISLTQRPGYTDYGRIQFTNVTGADIYSSGRIDLFPNDADQSVGLGNNLTSRRLASSTNYGAYGPTPPGFQVGTNAAFAVLSNNLDPNTDSFIFSGPTGARHFFKVVQNNVPYFTIMPTGNVLINTTTDSGYKLDVNGTTRFLASTETISRFDHTNGNYASLVVGNGSALAAGQFGMYFNGGPMWSWSGAAFRLHGNVLSTANNPSTLILQGGYGGSTVGTSIKLSSNTPNQGQWTATSGSQTTVEIGSHSNETWAPSSGNASYTLLSVAPRINTTGTYAGIVRGFYYNPILTSVTGVTHRAIETLTGDVIFGSISGSVGVGTTSPTQLLHVAGNLRLTGAFYDSNNQAGTAGQILKSTGTGTDWVSLSEITGVDGTGTANYLAKWSDADTITTSLIYDNGTNITVGTSTGTVYLNSNIGSGAAVDINSQYKFYYAQLQGNGSAYFTTYVTVGTTGNLGATLNVKGTGATSSTKSLYIANSDTTRTLSYTDDGKLTLSNGTYTTKWYTGSGYSPTLEFSAQGNITWGNGAIFKFYGTGDTTEYRLENGTFHTTNSQARFYAGGSGYLGFETVGATTAYDAIGAVFTDNNTVSLRFFYKNSASDIEGMRLTSSGNFLVGTTTDSGYKLDVNGTARIQGNLTVSSGNQLRLNDSTNANTATISYSSTGQQGPGVVSAWGGNGVFGWNNSVFNLLHAGTGNDVILLNRSVLSAGTTSGNALWLTGYGSFAPTTGTNSFNAVNIGTTYNATGGTSTIRGIYYNPVLTSMTGVTHRAIETVTGDVLFATTSGSVGIGTTSPDSKLHIEGTTTGSGSGADAIVHIKQNGGWNGNEPWALYVEGYSYLNGFRVNAYDTQRSLYSSAGELGFAVSGNSPISFTQNTSDYRMYIAPGGNIGIGTTTPTSKLTIGGTLASGFGLELNEGTYRGSFTATNGGTYVQGYSNGLHLGSNGNNTIKLTWDDKVGIGILSPSAKTHIVGLGSTSSTTSLLIQNSSNIASLTVLDNGLVSAGTSTSGVVMNNNGGYPSLGFWESIARWTIQRQGSDHLDFISNTTNGFAKISFVPGNTTGGVAIGNDTYQSAGALKAASAVLSLYAEAQGFLQPRLSTSQKNAISTPATGLQVYDSTLNKNALYNGSAWQSIATETWVTSQAYVPQATTITINGTTYDLSANRSWTIATTTPGGSNTQFQYNSSGTLAGASALTYNSATNRVGINQASPGYDLDVNGQVRVQDKLRVGNVNSGNGVVHMSSTATINPSATTIVWSQNVSVGMCAFIEYYILNNNTTTDQRAGTIMVTWNQSGTPTIAHTETTTPDIGSTTAVTFTSSLVGSDARINAVNSSSAPYTIVMSYKYF